MTRTPHKHAELIKAWADGAMVQVCHGSNWFDCNSPEWNIEDEYRIKPEPKTDWVQFIFTPRRDADGNIINNGIMETFKVTRSGETGEPIKVEICK